jgi:hypothetical protein
VEIREHLEELGTSGRILYNGSSRNMMRMWVGFIWLRVVSTDRQGSNTCLNILFIHDEYMKSDGFTVILLMN